MDYKTIKEVLFIVQDKGRPKQILKFWISNKNYYSCVRIYGSLAIYNNR